MKRQSLIFITAFFALFSFSANAFSKNRNLPKHVILIGYDGLSSDCIREGADMPSLQKMMREGSYTLERRSVLPSVSACNWASMFMGASPELHGYTEWGSRVPELPSRVVNDDNRFPNIFGLYREADPKSEIGYIFDWEGMNFLVDTLAIDFRYCVPDHKTHSKESMRTVLKYLEEKRPNLCMIYFGETDRAGHNHGWGSPEYLQAAQGIDACVGAIIETIEKAGMMDETVVIVTSDHGGLKKGHGGKTMHEMESPLVFYGKNIKKGFVIPESVMVYDTAGTIAYLLDFPQPQVWIARPILSIFEKRK
ncbi:alkaline phosphatase [Proteiniphilum sp. X52]|uniref:alkaline phosphatase n=1 Tax=Proteiniphilum sp. X52 TaxID=2382159 RepID=UPI000F0A7300|nr:alkaline phosphatase [Proteiniphilum sp. X52]RNC63378.1 alkaline phosphatase [Proteiniphilum sp. X52]